MRLEKVTLKRNEHVTVTAYLLDHPTQFPNVTRRPAVLVFPGVMTNGGKVLTSQREAECIAMAYLAEGYQAFLLNYSMPAWPVFPGPIDDVQEVMDILYEKSADWEIDTNRIAAVAFSEGAYVAIAQAMTAQRHRPNALILGYPQIPEPEEVRPYNAPVLQEIADEMTPPVFLFSTHEDTGRPAKSCLSLLLALDKVGVPYEIHLFQKGAHGLSLGKSLCSSGMGFYVDANWAKWFELSVHWLTANWGEPFPYEGEFLNAADIGGYNIDTYIRDLAQNPACMAVVTEFWPEYGDAQFVAERMDSTLRFSNVWFPQPLKPDELERLNQRLRAIPLA